MKFSLVFCLFCLFSGPVFAVQYTGILTYPEAVSLTTPTTGVISKNVQVGGFYSKGIQLVEFDTSILKSQISVLKMDLKLQQKVYAEAKREFQRSEELYEGTMLSDHELKMAEIFELKEKKHLEEIKSALIKQSWELKYSSINAPFEGYVVALNALPNQFITNQLKATPLVKFIASENILLKVLVSNSQISSESKIKKLEVGDELIIQDLLTIGNGSDNLYRGKFIALIDSMDQMSNNKILILTFSKPLSNLSQVIEGASNKGNSTINKYRKLPLNKSLVKLLIE
jgi:hypothetical protein